MDGGQPMSEGRSSGVRAERAIRITTVVAVAVVAAFVSYRHMRGVAMAHGEDPMTAAVLPFSVDGLIVAASMAMLAERRAGRNRSWLSYVLLALGACASLLANVLHAEPTFTARIIAGWPPLALLGSYELLMRQIHPTARRSAEDPVTTVPIPLQRGPAPAVAIGMATTAAHPLAPGSDAADDLEPDRQPWTLASGGRRHRSGGHRSGGCRAAHRAGRRGGPGRETRGDRAHLGPDRWVGHRGGRGARRPGHHGQQELDLPGPQEHPVRRRQHRPVRSTLAPAHRPRTAPRHGFRADPRPQPQSVADPEARPASRGHHTIVLEATGRTLVCPGQGIRTTWAAQLRPAPNPISSARSPEEIARWLRSECSASGMDAADVFPLVTPSRATTA